MLINSKKMIITLKMKKNILKCGKFAVLFWCVCVCNSIHLKKKASKRNCLTAIYPNIFSQIIGKNYLGNYEFENYFLSVIDYISKNYTEKKEEKNCSWQQNFHPLPLHTRTHTQNFRFLHVIFLLFNKGNFRF